jgi:hypothetical protein
MARRAEDKQDTKGIPSKQWGNRIIPKFIGYRRVDVAKATWRV